MYSPNLVTIDLSEGKVLPKKTIEEKIVNNFLGGRGITVYLGYDSIPADTSPRGPENNIIFGTGPLTGTRLPSTGTSVATFKSPQTNTLYTSVCTGHFGAFLKATGIDFLKITGKAKTPSYILIDEFNEILIKSADDFWKNSIEQTDSHLRKLHGKQSSIACLGKAAVNQVLYTSLVVDTNHFFTRGGLGSIFASKNLKALVIQESPPTFSEDDNSDGIPKQLESVLSLHPWFKMLQSNGTLSIFDSILTSDILPSKNCSEVFGALPDLITNFTDPKNIYKCWQCPVKCNKSSYNNYTALGPNLRITDNRKIQNGINYCEQEGVDPLSTGAALASLFHIQEDRRKLLETNLGFKLGDPTIFSFIKQITKKESLGDQLSRGEEYLYLQTSEPSPMIKSQISGMYYFPNCPGLSIDQSTAPYQGSHFRGGTLLFSEILGFPYKMSIRSIYGKIPLKIVLEELSAVLDSLILCPRFLPAFLRPNLLVKFLPRNFVNYLIHIVPSKLIPYLTLDKNLLSDLVNNSNNKDNSINTLLRIGNRITLLERLFNTRSGLSRKSDTFAHYIEEKPEFYNRQITLLNSYYKSKGLTPEGLVELKTLKDSGLLGLVRI
ncbi:MAG: aldehyde ferredoxin oxidoreductase N-terminal domain-containing protein [Candidatus Hodarchaeales archaeon]|jgi:aldehyde:ferredoxin oxidoreductase